MTTWDVNTAAASVVLVPFFFAWTFIILACSFAIVELFKSRLAIKSEQSYVDGLYSRAKAMKLDEFGQQI